MSADNWAICPKCRDNTQKSVDEHNAAVYAKYGTVSPGDWAELLTTMRTVDEQAITTFREDYEFYGADEGTLHVSYGGSCGTCGLSLFLKEERKFYPENTP
jgi:hypothetical protein